MSKDLTFLFPSLNNFDGATPIDNIHLSFIDLESGPDANDIEEFLTNSHQYLDKEITFEIATELFTMISNCFSKYPDDFLSIFEEYFKKARLNSNYIIINTMILLELTISKPQSNIPDYNSFVNDALNEILPQIQKDDKSNLIVFGHEIPHQFKSQLILYLFLLSKPTKKLISDFLPFIFSQFLFSRNSKFELLLQNLSKSDFFQILPQNDQSQREIIEFITNKNPLGEVLKMSEAATSLLLCSAIFVQEKGQIKVNCLTKENIFPFLSTAFIISNQIYGSKFEPISTDLSDLIIEGTDHLLANKSPIITESIDHIMANYKSFIDNKLINIETLCKVLEKMIKNRYKSDKVTPLVAFNYIKTINRNLIQFNLIEMIQYSLENKSEISRHSIQLKIEGTEEEEESASNFLAKHISELNTHDEINEFLSFFECHFSLSSKVLTNISPSLLDLLKRKIKEEKWEDVLTIGKYIKNNKLNDLLQGLKDEPMTKEIKEFLFDSLTNETIDELITLFLNDPSPEKNEPLIKALFEKMIDDNEEMLHSYLCCFIYKYGKIFFQLAEYEKIFMDEYKKYGDKFISATNELYYYQNIRKIMLTRYDFRVSSLPVSESGFSVISKLFEIIEKNPNENYQAFFCLKCVSSAFPFLFTRNISSKIFDVVLPPFNNFYLIYDKNQTEEKLKLAKTAYAAFEFLYSALQSTSVFDDFIKWFFTNIESFSNSQVYALIFLFRFIYNDTFINTYSQAFILKYNFLETIAILLKREIKEDFFIDIYKENLYNFVYKTYDLILQMSRVDTIYIDLINQEEFPVQTIYEVLYSRIPFSSGPPTAFFNCVSELNEFINSVKNPREFWINHRSKYNNYMDDYENVDESMKDFETKLEFHEPLPPGGDRPVLYCTASIRMMKYLFYKPSFIFMWVIDNEIIPVVMELYQMILDTLKDLNEMNRNRNYDDPDDDNFGTINVNDKILPLFCQEKLYRELIDGIITSTKNSQKSFAIDLIQEAMRYPISLLSIFEFISQKITEIYTDYDSTFVDNFYLFLSIFERVNKDQVFNDNFIDLCGNKILDICLLPVCRTDNRILIQMYKLMKSTKLPNRSIYLIGFMILSGNQQILENGLELYGKIDKETQQLINQTIIIAFDKEYEKLTSTNTLKLLIENCPSIISERRAELMELLNKILDEYSPSESENEDENDDDDEDKFSLIGFLLTKLAPQRGKSSSLISIIEESSIPKEIKETNPVFWSVYEKHQHKILHKIESNPLLLNQFKFLLEFHELISFKIRSSYFSQIMHRKIHPYNELSIRVNSNDLLSSSFRQLFGKNKSRYLDNFYVVITGEDQGGDETVDAGGVTRQWFTKLSKELFNPNYGLFQCTKKLNFLPSSNSYVHENHLNYFRFAGRFVARAIIEGVCIDAHFTSSFCKQILNRAPNMKDLADVDEELFTNFEYTLLNKNVEDQYMVFEVNRDVFGKIVSFPLKENGGEIDVTNENKVEYVDSYVDFILTKEIENQIDAFCKGFRDLISLEEIKMFSPNELDMIICGIDNINVDDFIAHTTFEYPYTKDHPVIKMFFDLIRKWDNEKMAKLLFFMTGATHLPPSGFHGFCESSGHLLKIQAGGTPESLPSGHTCFNTLDLPQYEDEETMNKKLLLAIYECDSITNY